MELDTIYLLSYVRNMGYEYDHLVMFQYMNNDSSYQCWDTFDHLGISSWNEIAFSDVKNLTKLTFIRKSFYYDEKLRENKTKMF